MADLNRFGDLISGLDDQQKIALALWCADRAFIVIDALALTGDGRDRLEAIDVMVQNLWKGPGLMWQDRNLKDLAQECEMYTDDLVTWKTRDEMILSQIFPKPNLLSHDQTINAITDAVSIASSLSVLIPRPGNRDVVQALEAYYDIFYQPTWDYLAGDRTHISPDENRAISKVVDRNDPLKAALKKLENHVQLLRNLEKIDLNDSRLRGRG